VLVRTTRNSRNNLAATYQSAGLALGLGWGSTPPVGEIAPPELVVPAAEDPERPAGASVAFIRWVNTRSNTCFRGSARLVAGAKDVSFPVEWTLNGGSMPPAPSLLWGVPEMSGSIVGSTT
jgi:hypothetical protein